MKYAAVDGALVLFTVALFYFSQKYWFYFCTIFLAYTFDTTFGF